MKNKTNQNIYQQLERFAEVTKYLIKTGNVNSAKHCMQVAENIFNNGTTDLKNAIVNVYVFSISTFMEFHHCNIRNFFPITLLSEYQKQVNSSGT